MSARRESVRFTITEADIGRYVRRISTGDVGRVRMDPGNGWLHPAPLPYEWRRHSHDLEYVEVSVPEASDGVPDWSDRPLPEDAEIDAAHPTATGRHDLFLEAMRLVGARHSKDGLVCLVNWLLSKASRPVSTPEFRAVATESR